MSPADIALVRAHPAKYAKSWISLPLLDLMLDLQETMLQTSGETRKRCKKLYDKHRNLISHRTPAKAVAAQCVALKTELDYIINKKQIPPVVTKLSLLTRAKRLVGRTAFNLATQMLTIHKRCTDTSK